MKKLAILFFALIIESSAFAQQDAKAKAILSQVSQKFKALNIIKTNFSFTLDDPQNASVKQTQTGMLIANSKTGKFHVTLYSTGSKSSVDQEIISDSKTQWTYLKKDKEVQVNNAGKKDDELNPAQLFTMYEHGYKYLYTGDQKLNGHICQVIDLSPENADKTFFKIRLFIDKQKKQLYGATLFDKGGSKYTYILNTIIRVAKAGDNTFSFDIKTHPGVELVDLR